MVRNLIKGPHSFAHVKWLRNMQIPHDKFGSLQQKDLVFSRKVSACELLSSGEKACGKLVESVAQEVGSVVPWG